MEEEGDGRELSSVDWRMFPKEQATDKNPLNATVVEEGEQRRDGVGIQATAGRPQHPRFRLQTGRGRPGGLDVSWMRSPEALPGTSQRAGNSGVLRMRGPIRAGTEQL